SVLWWVLAPRRARWMRWADVQEGGPPVVARQGRSTRGGVRFDPTGEDPSRTAGAGRGQRSPLAPGGGRVRAGQRLPERHRRAPRGSSSPGAGLRGTDGGPALRAHRGAGRRVGRQSESGQGSAGDVKVAGGCTRTAGPPVRGTRRSGGGGEAARRSRAERSALAGSDQ